MSAEHPEVVAQRLAEAGIPEAVDYRQGPDLPSWLTFRELSLIGIFATKFAVEAEVEDIDLAFVSILVRDRGPDSQMLAPWAEFSVAGRRFAIWRNTGDLYEVGPDGAVSDDPIHRAD